MPVTSASSLEQLPSVLCLSCLRVCLVPWLVTALEEYAQLTFLDCRRPDILFGMKYTDDVSVLHWMIRSCSLQAETAAA